MSTNQTIARLEALRRSLEAARDAEQPRVNHFVTGLNAGLQIAIDAIDSELRMIVAGQRAAASSTPA